MFDIKTDFRSLSELNQEQYHENKEDFHFGWTLTIDYLYLHRLPHDHFHPKMGIQWDDIKAAGNLVHTKRWGDVVHFKSIRWEETDFSLHHRIEAAIYQFLVNMRAEMNDDG